MKKKWIPRHEIIEDDVEQYLVEQIETIGGYCIKGNPHNQRGMPDRICVLPFRLTIFVEVKRPGRKPRPNQRQMIKDFNALGHHAVYCSTPLMVDKLIAWCRVQFQKKGGK